jgi:ferredoxin--NADP+ reductase
MDQQPAIPAAYLAATIREVHHWTDRLFSFRCTRDPAFRFRAGEFVMIGLMVDGKPLVRAYSVASPTWEEDLEFLSIKVQHGPLTSRLQHVRPGDTLLVGRKPTGTLVTDNLLPGGTLWLLATGTGLAPFMSLIREPEVYERYDRVVVCHTVRQVAELAYRDLITRDLPEHELLGELLKRVSEEKHVRARSFAISVPRCVGCNHAKVGLQSLDERPHCGSPRPPTVLNDHGLSTPPRLAADGLSTDL